MSLGQENTSTLDEVTERLQDFLTNKESENIVLTGAWGTGKTQAWKRVVYRCINPRFVKEIVSFQPFKSVESSLKIYSLEDSKLPLRILPSITSKKSGFFKRLEERELELENRWKSFARRRYAYVSASDCATIKDLEDKIFDSVVPRRRAGKSQSSFGSFLLKGTGVTLIVTILVALILLCVLICQPGWLIKNFKSVQGLSIAAVVTALVAGGAACLQFPFNFWQHYQRRWLLKDAIICIDDIERASKKLEPQEILNLAADLKENKNCKVALILNPDQFYSESKEKILLISNLEQVNVNSDNTFKKAISIAQDKSSESSQKKSKKGIWQQALEKGSDSHLVLELDPKDAAKLAFINKDGKEIEDKNDPLVKALRPEVIALGINNVRIIQRIWRDSKRWEKYLEKISENFMSKLEPIFSKNVTDSKENCSKDLSVDGFWRCIAYYTAYIGNVFYNLQDGMEKLSYGALKGNLKTPFFAWESISKICFENIEKGLLNKEQAKGALEKYAEKALTYWTIMEKRGYDSQQKAILEEPRRLAETTSIKSNQIEKIQEALSKIEADDKIVGQILLENGMRLPYLHFLLCLAENKHINQEKWAVDFRTACKTHIEQSNNHIDFLNWDWSLFPTDSDLKKFCLEERGQNSENLTTDLAEDFQEETTLQKCLNKILYSQTVFKNFIEFEGVYKEWTVGNLQEIFSIKRYTSKGLIELVYLYWTKRVFGSRGYGTILEYADFLLKQKDENLDQAEIPIIRVYCQFGRLLREALKKELDKGIFINPDLEHLLSENRYSWEKLINLKERLDTPSVS